MLRGTKAGETGAGSAAADGRRRAGSGVRSCGADRQAADGTYVSAAGGCVCRETLSVQKALRPGTGTIHRERRMRSRFSVPQAQCL